jgi:Uma2 family endonuclease
MAIDIKFMTAEEFATMEQPDDGVSELIRGELVEMPPAARRHGRITGRISNLFISAIELPGLGTVSSTAGLILSRDPDTVVAPDAAVFLGEYVSPIDEDEKYNNDIPDIAVEVISPSGLARFVSAKNHLYLDAGVKMVIEVWPSERRVTVSTPDLLTRTLVEGDVIDFTALVPGCSIKVSDIFN